MSKKLDKQIEAVKNSIVKSISVIPNMSKEDTLKILENILEDVEDVIDHYNW